VCACWSTAKALTCDIPSCCRCPPQLKIILYLSWVQAEDVTTQRRGICSVVYFNNPTPRDLGDQEKKEMYRRLETTTFCRKGVVHFCFPSSPMFQLIKNVVMASFSDQYRKRIRFHSGMFKITTVNSSLVLGLVWWRSQRQFLYLCYLSLIVACVSHDMQQRLSNRSPLQSANFWHCP
jgi:hypothetical protein